MKPPGADAPAMPEQMSEIPSIFQSLFLYIFSIVKMFSRLHLSKIASEVVIL